MDHLSADHPAVGVAMALLSHQNAALTTTPQRDNVVAVVAENDTTRWHILIEQVDGRWETPTLITGNGRQPETRRQASTRNPPMLAQKQMTRSGRPGPDGRPPAASWCVLTGRATTDATRLTVDTGLDVQTCTVDSDGYVNVLFFGPWGEPPKMTMETITGAIITLFNG